MQFFFLFFVFIFGWCIECRAERFPVWRFWTAADGFEESNCASVSITSDGRVLVNHGGVRQMSILDGYHIHKIPSPSPHVRVYEGPQGNLWAFSSVFLSKKLCGFTTYDPAKKQWIEFLLPGLDNILFGPGAWRFASIQPHYLLFAVDDHVQSFDTRTRKTENVIPVSETKNTKFTYAVSPSKEGGAWVSGDKSVLHVQRQERDIDPFSWTEFPYPVSATSPSAFHNKVIGTDGRLFTIEYPPSGPRSLIQLNKGNWETVFSHETVHFHLGWQDTAGRCWLFGNGMRDDFHVVEQDRIMKIDSNNLIPMTIQSLALQEQNVFWLAMPSGLARYAPPLWQAPIGASRYDENLFTRIVEDSQGHIWYAGVSLLLRISDEGVKSYPYPKGKFSSPLNPRNCVVLADGSILMCGGNMEYFRFQPNEEKFDLYNHPKYLADSVCPYDIETVWTLTRDKDNRYKTLELYDGETFQKVLDVHSIPDFPQWIIDIHETKNGDIWFGHTLEMGPGRIRKGEFNIFGPEDGYQDVGAPCFLELDNGNIWVGGRNSISEYDGKQWKTVLTNLCAVPDMIQARDGSIWVASESGVHRHIDGYWITYTQEQGLPVDFCANIHEDRQGRIWVATTGGIRCFSPEADRDPPETYFDIQQNPQEVGPHGKATFVFSGIDKWKYTPKNQLYYSHRIDDGPWSTFDLSTVAVYSNLAAGNHWFEVHAMDCNLNVDPTPIRFPFQVVTVWYKEPVFLILITAGILILFISIAIHLFHHFNLENAVKERTRHLLAHQKRLQSLTAQLSLTEEQERRKIASDLHDRIGHGLAACRMIISTIQRKTDGNSAENEIQQAKEIITQTIKDTRTLTFEISPPVLYEFGLGAALEWLVEQFQNQYGMHIQFNEDANEKPLRDDVLGFLFRSVRELLFNIVKHAKTDSAVISLTKEGDHVQIVVEDHGIGFDYENCSKSAKANGGYGIFRIRERIEYLNGTFLCESPPQGGTRIVIQLPLSGIEK